MDTVSALLVDLNNCIGCYNCQVGCHTWHKVTEDQRVEMVILDPEEVDGVMKAEYFPLMTHNCDLCFSRQVPICVDVCPTEALMGCDKKLLVSMLNSNRRCIVAKVDKGVSRLGRRI